MEINKLLDALAYKYKDNFLARLLVRPIYRMKVKYEENRRRSFYLLNANRLLVQLKSALDDNNCFFWLDFGTLLGAYREKDFIKHDLDLDIGVFYKDAGLVRKSLLNNGFKILREYRVGCDGALGLEETYSYEKVTVDVFYFHIEGDIMFCNTFSPLKEKNANMSLFQVKQITVPYTGFALLPFKGMNFNAPKDIVKHLEAHYGKNFMIPNANFDYKKEATNIHWFSKEERIGVYKSFNYR